MGESEVWAEWSLDGLEVAQLCLDYSLHIHLWTLKNGLSLTLSTPFTYSPGTGEPLTIDPEQKGAVIPALDILHEPAFTFRASSLGRCELHLEDGAFIASEAHPKYEAWESSGSGTLLLSTIGPGSPWGKGPPPSERPLNNTL